MPGKLTDTTLMQLYTLANRHGYQAFARHAKNLLAPTQQPSGGVTDDDKVCAERYRWLRDNKHLDAWWSVAGPIDRCENIDADIDGAMTAARAQGGES
jgi:hypothetical protein